MSVISRRGIVWDHLIPWIIAVAVLVAIVLFSFILSGKLDNLVDYIRGIFR